MSDEEILTLYINGFPPTVNNYYVHTRRGVFISTKGKAFRKVVMEAVREQNANGVIGGERIYAEVTLFPPDRRVRDLGNYDKSLMDALTHADVWDDDAQIDQQMFYRGEVVKGGLVKIEMGPAGPIVPVSWEG